MSACVPTYFYAGTVLRLLIVKECFASMHNAVPPTHRLRYERRCSTAPDTLIALDLAIGSDTALRTKKQKARSPFGASGLLGEGRGIYTTLSEILGCRGEDS